ncbi:hypothetical protein AB0C52_02900 [Streptomyces sp. NPDC048717]|uniref:hypothetical protein n=1 Tax=Streptomyces sp. NPDC048717 TaxID=3154928 RepID=UPI003413A7AA
MVSEHIAQESPQPATMPPVGSYMVDIRMATTRPGRVMAHEGDLIFLRPVCGGTEWTAHAEDLRPPNETERERIRVLTTPVPPAPKVVKP